MAPKLYWNVASPPSRAVVFCARELGVELELKEVNLVASEHKTPEYLKMNPLHTVPVLDDDGYIIIDSHAIMPYLVGKYRRGSSLYPEDLKKRAKVDQMLHFDTGTLFGTHIRILLPLFNKKVNTLPQNLLTALSEAYGCLEVFLQDQKYVAGDELTIADFNIWTTITNSSKYLPLEGKKYPNITLWLERMRKTPHNELNEKGGQIIKTIVESLLHQ